MSKKSENVGFLCEHCGREVKPLSNGSYRNHCPFCLYSKHVDNLPGDRASECGGLMEPVGVIYKSNKKGFQLKHRCLRCGHEGYNIVAAEDEQSDDFDKILNLMKQDPNE
jgi:hypothetical protein